MGKVYNVFTEDNPTRDITALINATASAVAIDPELGLALILAESNLHEAAVREHPWPDVSYGLCQQTVKWIDPRTAHIIGLSQDTAGTISDTPQNRARAKAWFSVAENAIPFGFRVLAVQVAKYGNTIEALCRYNKPSLAGVDNPNRAHYLWGMAAASAYTHAPVDSSVTQARILVLDWRESPIIPRNGYYSRRDPAGITAMVVHHADAVADIQGINTYHKEKSWDSTGSHAPHIAYTYYIPYNFKAFAAAHGIVLEADVAGILVWCNYYWERTWSQTLGNDQGLSVCVGMDADTVEPPQSVKLTYQYAYDVEIPRQLGRRIARSRVFGHGETPLSYGGGPDWDNNTGCPGKLFIDNVKAFRTGTDFAALGSGVAEEEDMAVIAQLQQENAELKKQLQGFIQAVAQLGDVDGDVMDEVAKSLESTTASLDALAAVRTKVADLGAKARKAVIEMRAIRAQFDGPRP